MPPRSYILCVVGRQQRNRAADAIHCGLAEISEVVLPSVRAADFDVLLRYNNHAPVMESRVSNLGMEWLRSVSNGLRDTGQSVKGSSSVRVPGVMEALKVSQ